MAESALRVLVVDDEVPARRRLRDAGIPDASSLARGAVLLGSWVVAAHTIGHAASTRSKRRTEASR